MTSEERLKQVEILLETAARYIVRHDEQIAQLNQGMLQLVDMFTELASIVRQNDERYQQNQEEIRRIWEYLLS